MYPLVDYRRRLERLGRIRTFGDAIRGGAHEAVIPDPLMRLPELDLRVLLRWRYLAQQAQVLQGQQSVNALLVYSSNLDRTE